MIKILVLPSFFLKTYLINIKISFLLGIAVDIVLEGIVSILAGTARTLSGTLSLSLFLERLNYTRKSICIRHHENSHFGRDGFPVKPRFGMCQLLLLKRSMLAYPLLRCFTG